MGSMKTRLASVSLLGCLTLLACSDEGEDDGTTSTSSASSGATTSGSGTSSSSSGSTTTGTGGMGGGGGDGGSGGSGGGGFGPCHGYTDDFTGFDPASATDYWAVDGAAAEPDPDPAMALTPVGIASYAGAYSETAAAAANCFTSIRVEDEGAGSVFFEIVEGTGAGPKVILEHAAGTVSANEILDAMGNGNNLGTLAVTELRGFRVQVLADEMRFEVDDGGTWTEVGVLTPLPAWAADDVNIGFGMSDPGASTTVFDDYNADEPL